MQKQLFSSSTYQKLRARNRGKVEDDTRLALSNNKPQIPKLVLWLQSQLTVALTDVNFSRYLKFNIFEVF